MLEVEAQGARTCIQRWGSPGQVGKAYTVNVDQAFLSQPRLKTAAGLWQGLEVLFWDPYGGCHLLISPPLHLSHALHGLSF